MVFEEQTCKRTLLSCRILGRKFKDIIDFDWKKLDLDDIVGATKYPKLPKK
jgi:hypothetical protein